MKSASIRRSSARWLSDLLTWYPCFWRPAVELATAEKNRPERDASHAWRLRVELVLVDLRQDGEFGTKDEVSRPPLTTPAHLSASPRPHSARAVPSRRRRDVCR